jgi:hypothetical protein
MVKLLLQTRYSMACSSSELELEEQNKTRVSLTSQAPKSGNGDRPQAQGPGPTRLITAECSEGAKYDISSNKVGANQRGLRGAVRRTGG